MNSYVKYIVSSDFLSFVGNSGDSASFNKNENVLKAEEN
jgi:hypothetical protein